MCSNSMPTASSYEYDIVDVSGSVIPTSMPTASSYEYDIVDVSGSVIPTSMFNVACTLSPD
jgi:hypothetical protein